MTDGRACMYIRICTSRTYSLPAFCPNFTGSISFYAMYVLCCLTRRSSTRGQSPCCFQVGCVCVCVCKRERERV